MKIEKRDKNMILFLLLTFLLPLLSIALQSVIDNAAIKFILYGIEAASPSIAAIVILCLSKQIKAFFAGRFPKQHLLTAFLLPAIMVSLTMLLAKGIVSLIIKDLSFFGTVSFAQFFIILWSFVAEELGWRGYLQPLLTKKLKHAGLVPFIVGVIWCVWHYHYFLVSGMQVPFVLFFVSCIVESYLHSYLLAFTNNNLIASMMYHFVWNLSVHVFAINPVDNNGSLLPYTILVLLELLTLLACFLVHKKYDQAKRQAGVKTESIASV